MLSGKVQTVCGLIDPSELGITLTHEHIVMDYKGCFKKPWREVDLELTKTPEITLQNAGWVNYNPYSHYFNLSLGDEGKDIINEVQKFKDAGGSCIVEVTTKGIHPKIEMLKEVSMATGIHIIHGTGYYLEETQSDDVKSASVEELSKIMVKELTEGVQDTGLKCGVIGEIGCSFPLLPNERKSLEATAIAQVETGAPVIIHPGRFETSPLEIIRILQEAGGDISQTVISHLDRTIFSEEKLFELAATKCYLEYDFFGIEVSYYQPVPEYDLITDAQRIQRIKSLIEEGYEDKIVIAHDIHTRHRLVKYGGHGYAHILNYAVPKMLSRDISQAQINKILIENPRKWLTFK